jgi:hypothetical protein
MDIGIASAAVALLAPYLGEAAVGLAAGANDAADQVGTEAGKVAWRLGEKAFAAIRDAFTARKNEYGELALKRLKEQPASEARQTALAGAVVEEAEADPSFAQQLQQLVEEARNDKQVTQFMTQVYGNAKVDKLLNIGTVNAQTFTV